jgi:transposase
MSLRPADEWIIPEETVRVAHKAFRKPNQWMHLRDELGVLYPDSTFAPLFSRRGHPAASPGRLALVTVVQFAEGLTDREAAEAVRSRIDLKYLLGLDLSDCGFDASVLSEFRQRLVQGGAENQLLDDLLQRLKAKGALKARGQQRSDSTHVLDGVRTLNRLELLAETMRHALNTLAGLVPQWLQHQVPPVWFERYGDRIQASRLPKAETERLALAATIGADGWTLFQWLWQDPTLRVLCQAPALDALRHIWLQNFYWQAEHLVWRRAADLPPAAVLLQSPYDVETHYSTKRSTEWIGYKVHVTESCAAETPHLITHVATTAANVRDHEVLPTIHVALAAKDLLPDEHLVDAGYLDADVLVTSQQQHQVQLVGRITPDHSWQAQQGQGFALAAFGIDWAQQRVTCPQGHASRTWSAGQRQGHDSAILVQFAKEHCAACPVRRQCTHSAQGARTLKLLPRAEYEALALARQRQHQPAFQKQYAKRAGIESTLSQGVRAFELRSTRYLGLAKTHLQHVATATAINLKRYFAWLTHAVHTRPTPRFAALAPATA